MLLSHLTYASGQTLHFAQNVKLNGELAQRIALTERRLQHHPFSLEFIVQDVARIEGKLRRFEDYEGDVSGRVLGAWSYICRLLNQRPEKLDAIADKILKHQKPQGYFGRNQQGEGWDKWGRQNFGHGRLLVGLVEYYKLTKEKRFLTAGEKLGDYFVRTIPKWTTEYSDNPWTDTSSEIDWQDNQSVRRHFVKTHHTSVLEGLMLLYEISPKRQYLDTAKKLVDLFPSFGQYHSHSYLNTMVGIAMLYRQTGTAEYLDRLERDYWRHIIRYCRRPDGGVCEFYTLDLNTEGCSLADWLRLNLQMWQLTKEAVYIEQAERVWFNSLNFHQTHNGAFGHAALSPNGYDIQYHQAWWCCLMRGLFAYAEIVNYTFAADQNNLYINFYTPMTCQVIVNDTPVHIEMNTAYPGKGDVKIKFSPKNKIKFTARLRIPRWADNYKATVNGNPVTKPAAKNILSVTRQWQKGDVLKLEFPIQLRLEDEKGNQVLEQRSFGDYYHSAYFFHGPLILGADSERNPKLPDSIILNLSKHHRFTEVMSNPYSISQAHYKLPAQIGLEKSEVILVPISESTGYGNWTDKLEGFLRNGSRPIQHPCVQIRHNVKIIGK